MKFSKFLILGSLTTCAFLGANPGQAQSSSLLPAVITGGFANFTPNVTLPNESKNTAQRRSFLLPGIATSPDPKIVAEGPAFFDQNDVIFPLSQHSEPTVAGNFLLDGEIQYSYPADNITLTFSNFRVDQVGNVSALIQLNAEAPSEMVILNESASTSGIVEEEFVVTANESVSSAFAQFINSTFGSTVLTAGQQVATLLLAAEPVQQ
jgi:hypothetical protein